MATQTGLGTVDSPMPRITGKAAWPDVYAVDLAERVVRVHCAVMQYPKTMRCNNCGWPFPCRLHRWGQRVLLAAGWSEAEIARLDTRTGAWA